MLWLRTLPKVDLIGPNFGFKTLVKKGQIPHFETLGMTDFPLGYSKVEHVIESERSQQLQDSHQ
jgi:hypothetical protein